MTPISLHPDNGHYFLFRDKPTILITSAEHYGAVLNLDFDYRSYLKELQAKGLNQTRAFSGAYREVPGNFNIQNNTLAPQPDKFCAPWPRSATPGSADGLPKFDLSRWNEDYFRRLQDYCREAGRHGVVVELVLFCPFYEENMWNVSPMNVKNNVNGVGDAARTEVYTLRHPKLLAVQDALTRKLVEATASFDNVYYEICNEPYFGGVTLDWQTHVADTIRDAERNQPARHLIAQNIANGSAEIKNANPQVSVFNFHYASPPDAVRVNYALNRVIAFDETGFKGTDDVTYRKEAWDFLLAGGGVFSHLDYSFTAGQEKGTFAYPASTPGGGGPALRAQLKTLRDFLYRFDFIRMRPDVSFIRSGVPEGGTAQALTSAGEAYVLYLKGGKTSSLTLDIPAGRYEAEWLHPHSGTTEKIPRIDHSSSSIGLTLAVPAYQEDIALRVVRKKR